MQVPGLAPLRIGLFAPRGRMGAALIAEIEAATDVTRDDAAAEVLIDFSTPAAIAQSLDRATRAAVPLIVGTTGLDALADERIARAAGTIAVLQSANMSLGVALLEHLVGEAAARLGSEWDIEILEMHHAAKIDAPSGTALMLGARAAKARGIDAHPDGSDRSGIGAPGSIGYACMRGGTVTGDHDVVFAGPSERLILSHRAESRAIFARGALTAARWIVGKPPGRYTMRDVLDL